MPNHAIYVHLFMRHYTSRGGLQDCPRWHPGQRQLQLIVDNLLDASHTQFVHQDLLGTDAFARSTHYLFLHTRNFEVNDQRVDERIRRWQKEGLANQDGPIIEACQFVMQDMGEPTDLYALKPVLLKIDTACVKARRVLAKLLEDEQHGQRFAV